jgi:hypothetical protein
VSRRGPVSAPCRHRRQNGAVLGGVQGPFPGHGTISSHRLLVGGLRWPYRPDMTHLADTIPDPDVLLAFEPEELGLRVLPILADWPRGEMLELGRFLTRTLGPSNIPGQGPSSQHPPYPHARRHELEQAIAEAWAWLEGAALLIPARGHVGHHEVRVLSRKARQLAKENNPASTPREG